MRRTIQRLIRRVLNGGAGTTPHRLTPSNDILNQVSKTHQQAALRLSNKAICDTNNHRNKLVKTSRENTHPQIIEFYRFLSKELAKRNYPFYAFDFYRSHERQNNLFKATASKAKGGQSPHNFGLAVDIVHSTRYWDLTQKEWAIIGAIGKEIARKRKIPITWGGDWDFYDPAHWQLKNWKQLRAAQIHLERYEPGFHEMPDQQRFQLMDITAKAHAKAKKAMRA